MRIVASCLIVLFVVAISLLEPCAAQERSKGLAAVTTDNRGAKESPVATDGAAATTVETPTDAAAARYASEVETADAEYAKASTAIRTESDEKFAAIKATYDDVARRSRDAYVKALEAHRERATKTGNQAEADAMRQKIDLVINGPPRNEVQKLWTASFAAESSADYEGALAAVDKLIQTTGNSQNAFTQLRLGWLYYLSGNHDRAEAQYKAAAALAPKSITPLQGLLNCYLARNRSDEAIDAARSVLKLDPLNYSANKTLGDLYYAKEDYTRSGAYYQRLVTTHIDDLQAAACLGWCYLKLDHKPLALQIFGDILAVQPDNVLASSGFVTASQEKTNVADATQAADGSEKIVIRNPKSTNRPVNYTLNGQLPATLKPGSEQTLDAGRPWTIRFDQGGTSGQVQYRLEAGRYEFGAEGNRWKFARQPD